jgi:hypothetical protein
LSSASEGRERRGAIADCIALAAALGQRTAPNVPSATERPSARRVI